MNNTDLIWHYFWNFWTEENYKDFFRWMFEIVWWKFSNMEMDSIISGLTYFDKAVCIDIDYGRLHYLNLDSNNELISDYSAYLETWRMDIYINEYEFLMREKELTENELKSRKEYLERINKKLAKFNNN